jgi:hypothetical protein
VENPAPERGFFSPGIFRAHCDACAARSTRALFGTWPRVASVTPKDTATFIATDIVSIHAALKASGKHNTMNQF